ncbi:MAG: efflux RND transporter periplasmic adaptor subunit [Opitutales bacterium]
MIIRFLIAIVVVILLIGSLVGVKALQIMSMIAAGEHMGPTPETVATTEVRSTTWQGRLTAVGTVEAVQGVTLQTEVPGIVREIRFKSGASVQAGDVLLVLDAETEQAQLKAAEADAELARLDFQRMQQLRKSDAVSASQLDQARARLESNRAAVENIEAVIAKKTIRAPFDGVLGIRQADLGQYLAPGAPIASLQQFAPVYVNFNLPQQVLAQVSEGMAVRITTDAVADRTLVGALTAIDAEVDPGTRNIRLQATIENAEGKLRPGMFVNLAVKLPVVREVLVVPQTAILAAPYGDSVYRVKPAEAGGGQVVEQQFVQLGETRGDFVAVETGIEAGETIVSAGVFKLSNGMSIAVNNELAPDPRLDPNPPDA